MGSDVAVLPARVAPVLAVLPHMLRNALDHGIEPRGARGDKSAHAAIELVFRDAGDAWQIAVRDDGRGIDVDRLKARAIELGLVDPGATLSHDELCALIFAPKLSTAEEVSEISGRGEGMAAVAEAVARCNGTISVRTGHNAGTTIRIAIPKPPAQA